MYQLLTRLCAGGDESASTTQEHESTDCGKTSRELQGKIQCLAISMYASGYAFVLSSGFVKRHEWCTMDTFSCNV
jgi:hypothetical protein